MADGGASIYVAVALSAVTAAAAAQEAEQQKKVAKRKAEKDKLALEIATERELNANSQRFQKALGRGAASAGARGVSVTEGSALDLNTSLIGQFLNNEFGIRTNSRMGNASIDSQRDANTPNTSLAAISGGISGFQTGYSIGSAIDESTAAKEIVEID